MLSYALDSGIKSIDHGNQIKDEGNDFLAIGTELGSIFVFNTNSMELMKKYENV